MAISLVTATQIGFELASLPKDSPAIKERFEALEFEDACRVWMSVHALMLAPYFREWAVKYRHRFLTEEEKGLMRAIYDEQMARVWGEYCSISRF